MDPQLFFITGKGGVGKTTVAAALGAQAARDGQRVLIVEFSADRSLAALFGKRELKQEPTQLAPRLFGVRVEQRALVEDYFNRLLRLQFLTRRLFASNTFNAVTTAAPGVLEFLTLEHLTQWLDAGIFNRKRPYDMILIDGPATGHALRLLRTPRQIATMVPGGPIGSAARKLLALLADHARTHVLLVTIADEMSVNETIEAHAAVADDLCLDLTRPVLNRVFPRRFNRDDQQMVQSLGARHPHDALLAAARVQIAARHDAERHISRLRRAFGTLPISIRQVCADGLGREHVEQIGHTLVRGLFHHGNGNVD